MKYQTLFIEDRNAEALTEHVNKLEREGWEFVSVQLACWQLLPDRGSARDARPQEGPKLLSKMLATLRREANPETPAPRSHPLPPTETDYDGDHGDE